MVILNTTIQVLNALRITYTSIFTFITGNLVVKGYQSEKSSINNSSLPYDCDSSQFEFASRSVTQQLLKEAHQLKMSSVGTNVVNNGSTGAVQTAHTPLEAISTQSVNGVVTQASPAEIASSGTFSFLDALRSSNWDNTVDSLSLPNLIKSIIHFCSGPAWDFLMRVPNFFFNLAPESVRFAVESLPFGKCFLFITVLLMVPYYKHVFRFVINTWLPSLKAGCQVVVNLVGMWLAIWRDAALGVIKWGYKHVSDIALHIYNNWLPVWLQQIIDQIIVPIIYVINKLVLLYTKISLVVTKALTFVSLGTKLFIGGLSHLFLGAAGVDYPWTTRLNDNWITTKALFKKTFNSDSELSQADQNAIDRVLNTARQSFAISEENYNFFGIVNPENRIRAQLQNQEAATHQLETAHQQSIANYQQRIAEQDADYMQALARKDQQHTVNLARKRAEVEAEFQNEMERMQTRIDELSSVLNDRENVLSVTNERYAQLLSEFGELSLRLATFGAPEAVPTSTLATYNGRYLAYLQEQGDPVLETVYMRPIVLNGLDPNIQERYALTVKHYDILKSRVDVLEGQIRQIADNVRELRPVLASRMEIYLSDYATTLKANLFRTESLIAAMANRSATQQALIAQGSLPLAPIIDNATIPGRNVAIRTPQHQSVPQEGPFTVELQNRALMHIEDAFANATSHSRNLWGVEYWTKRCTRALHELQENRIPVASRLETPSEFSDIVQHLVGFFSFALNADSVLNILSYQPEVPAVNTSPGFRIEEIVGDDIPGPSRAVDIPTRSNPDPLAPTFASGMTYGSAPTPGFLNEDFLERPLRGRTTLSYGAPYDESPVSYSTSATQTTPTLGNTGLGVTSPAPSQEQLRRAALTDAVSMGCLGLKRILPK